MAETKNMATGVAVEEAGNDNAKMNTLLMQAAGRWVGDIHDKWPLDWSSRTISSMMNDFCVLNSEVYDRRGYDGCTSFMNMAGFLGELLDALPEPVFYTTEHMTHEHLHDLVHELESALELARLEKVVA